ncbi:MAG TPA: polysaccharide biosynthesis/export family protein, partial [Urbifossiella sp.]|nr:polysaccharide biosynthesis/export family protein [Urbifossiella sp.]
VAVLGAGGCAGGPQPVADGIPVRRLPAEVLGRPKGGLEPVPLPLLRKPEAPAYRVDKSDVLTVFAEDVLGARNQIPVQANANPAAPTPAAQGYPVTVQDDGTIIIPEVPPIPVKGKTLPEVRDAVVKAITVDKKLIVPGKERVSVDLFQKRRVRVLVVRDDLSPDAGGASLLLDADRSDVLEALTRTGGFPGPNGKPEVLVRRGPAGGPDGLTARIPLRVPPGLPVPFAEADITLGEGDTVHVMARDEEDVYTVVGGTGCGAHLLPQTADLRVVEALSRAGCPAPACGVVTVVRKLGCDRQLPIRVNLAEALRDPRENILILPGDTIVLPGAHGCGAGACPPHRWFKLPGWFSPLGPRGWPVLGCDNCGDF